MKPKINIVFAFALSTLFASAGILNLSGEEKMNVSVLIHDLNADTAVVAYNHQCSMVPASVTKSITAATSLSLLPRDFSFETRVVLKGSPAKDKHIFNGDLIVYGSGDPTLESDNFKEYQGFCDSVAAALKNNNITEISGHIIAVDTLSDSGPVELWEIDDVPWAYGAGIYGLNWRDNIMRVWPVSGKTEPSVPQLKINRLRRGKLSRGMGSETLNVPAKYFKSRKSSFTTTMPYPHKSLQAELKSALANAGINVKENNEYHADNETTAYVHKSPVLTEILQSLMFRSDNMFAEGMLRALAPEQTRDSCIAVEREFWTDRGLDMEAVNIMDGSGLTRSNFFSADFEASVLKEMLKSEYAKSYVSLFPVAGRNGTMRNFLKDTPFEGRMALKTGSMNGVQTYAGYYLDQEGKPSHVVVVFVNSLSCPRVKLRQAIAEMFAKYLLPQPEAESETENDRLHEDH